MTGISQASFTAEVIPAYANRVETALEGYLPRSDEPPQDLHEAMRYSVLGGGKRLRALLVYAAGTVCGAHLEDLDAPASAVELLHAYSLIHDDLPAMDDDELRRGKPSCHIAFGEATAILAGDALQSLAFEVAAHGTAAVPNKQIVARLERFAHASGSRGMVGGQAIDLASEGIQLTLEQTKAMHARKTGALIVASLTMGALTGPDVDRELLDRLEAYGRYVGLAFQIRDDILDVEGDTETLGKPKGSDEAAGKSTYPALLGLDVSKREAEKLHEKALAQLGSLDARADALRALSEFAITRPS